MLSSNFFGFCKVYFFYPLINPPKIAEQICNADSPVSVAFITY